jgi:S-adenosylmethionine:tRNA ribosyltransferase-isomerase
MERRPSYPIARLDYELPPELIAQKPLSDRSTSRLLYVKAVAGAIEDHRFVDLPELLPARTLVVLNDSRVVPARVFGRRAVNELGQGGGRVEVLYHRWLGDGVCEAVVGSGASQPAGEQVLLPGGWRCELLEPKQLDGIRVRYLNESGAPASISELMGYLDEHGLPPTPPYIKRELEVEVVGKQLRADRERYQTVYARQDGSVAAPTAGLHFDLAMLDRLARDGHSMREVTLHVGLGTFAPVRVDDLARHRMHAESYRASRELLHEYFAARATDTPVLAVGTTSLRVLHTLVESASEPPPTGETIAGDTEAFIYPGRGTEACDLLLTNFHLPRSTLLALVYAFGGEELIRGAYRHAISQRYRFYSYGDCMLIDRRN